MLEALLLILKSNKLATFLGALLIAASITVAVQHFRISFLDDKVAADKITIDGITEANAQLTASLAQQNAAVTKLKVDSDARIAESAKALDAARGAVALSGTRAADILKFRATGDECQQSKQVIDHYYGGLQP